MIGMPLLVKLVGIYGLCNTSLKSGSIAPATNWVAEDFTQLTESSVVIDQSFVLYCKKTAAVVVDIVTIYILRLWLCTLKFLKLDLTTVIHLVLDPISMSQVDLFRLFYSWSRLCNIYT